MQLTNGHSSFLRTYLLLVREEGRKRRQGWGATALNHAAQGGLSEAIFELNKVGSSNNIFIIKEMSMYEGTCTQLKDASGLLTQPNQCNMKKFLYLEYLSYNE